MGYQEVKLSIEYGNSLRDPLKWVDHDRKTPVKLCQVNGSSICL